jgi:NAD(P)H-nitrite reductase large subunit
MGRPWARSFHKPDPWNSYRLFKKQEEAILKLGEKGAIPQRDKETYAIAPHIPCGVVTPAMLRKLADVAEKYKAQAMKITSATRSPLWD